MSVLVGASSNSKLCSTSTTSSELKRGPIIKHSAGAQEMGTSREPNSQENGRASSSSEIEDEPNIAVPATTTDDDLVGNLTEGTHDVNHVLARQFSRSSLCESENEEDSEQDQLTSKSFLISPIVPLKDQIEKDKDDESLRRWKEQLLGSCLQLDPAEGVENVEPQVHVLNFTILSDDRPEILIPLPLSSNHKMLLFTLKEGCTYKIKFTFSVRHNIVSGLTYIRTVWKNGFKVENTKTMLGTFGPQIVPYTHTMEEETTPSGLFARGSYTSRIRFVDDDGRSHLDIQHTFAISKDWQ